MCDVYYDLMTLLGVIKRTKITLKVILIIDILVIRDRETI